MARIKHIDGFLDNKLQGAELDEFNQLLKEDPQLLEILAEATIRDYARISLKKKLVDIDNRILSRKKQTSRYILGIASSLLILVGLSVAFKHFIPHNSIVSNIDAPTNSNREKPKPEDNTFDQTQQLNQNEVEDIHANKELIAEKSPHIVEEPETKQTYNFANYFNTYPKPTYRNANEKLDRAFKYYEIGKYDSAKLFFKESLVTVSNEEELNEILYYQAICLLASSSDSISLKIAQKSLVALKEDGQFALHTQAKWYLALTNVQLGNIEGAISILNEIVHNKHYNYDIAQELLKQLQYSSGK